MILPVIKKSKWEILTPDNLSDGHTYTSLAGVKKAKIKFIKRYLIQGYYRSANGEKILIEDLENRVAIVEKK